MRQKRVIRLSEAQLVRVILENVRDILNEGKYKNNEPIFYDYSERKTDRKIKPGDFIRNWENPPYELGFEDEDLKFNLEQENLEKNPLFVNDAEYKRLLSKAKETGSEEDYKRLKEYAHDIMKDAMDRHNNRFHNYDNVLGGFKRFIYNSKEGIKYIEDFKEALEDIGMTYREFIQLPLKDRQEMLYFWENRDDEGFSKFLKKGCKDWYDIYCMVCKKGEE